MKVSHMGKWFCFYLLILETFQMPPASLCKTAIHFTTMLKWFNLELFCSLDWNETLLCGIISTKYYQVLNVPLTGGLIQTFYTTAIYQFLNW